MLGHVDMGYKIYKPSRSGNLNFYNLDRDVDELVINKGSGNIGIGNLPDINLPQKKLSVGGDVLITDDLTVDRNVIIGENIQIDGTMLIKDTSTFKKDVSMETNLELDGILTVNNTSTFVNDITLNTNMSVQNNLTVDNILTTKQLKLTEDNLILPTVKSGHVLIANGTNYRGKALGGVIAINSEGETSFVNGQLLNIHIKDGEITNEKINGATRINITKTDLEGGNDITLTGNRLDIDTVFVRNDSNSNKQGNLIMNALDGDSDTKLNIFSNKVSELSIGINDNSKWAMTNDNNTFYLKNHTRGSGIKQPIKIDGNTGYIGIGSTTEIPRELMDIFGTIRTQNLKIEQEFNFINATSNQILIADGDSFIPKDIFGDMTLLKSGELIISDDKISNRHISNDNTDLIDISKTTFKHDDNFTLSDNGMLALKPLFLLNTGNVSIDGTLTITDNQLIMPNASDASLMISNGTSFTPKVLNGAVRMNNDGFVQITAETIVDGDINNNAFIDIDKTNLRAGDNISIEDWIHPKTGKKWKSLKVDIETGVINNDDIAQDANLDISKTNLSVNEFQINYDINRLSINDIFLKNYEDDRIDASLTIRDSLIIETDHLQMATNTSGFIMVADDNKFVPREMTGDVLIDSTGQTSINSGVIINDDISKDAAIQMSKTNFSPTNKFIFDLNDGSFDIDDIYVKKIGDEMSNTLTIKETDAPVLILKGSSNYGCLIDMYTESDGRENIRSGFIGWSMPNTTLKMHNDLLGNKISFNGPIGLNNIDPTESLDLNGNIKIRGMNNGIIFADIGGTKINASNKTGNLLVADGNKFNPITINGAITFNELGFTTIVDHVVENKNLYDGDDTNRKIQIEKTALIAGTDITLTDNTLNIDDVFLRKNSNNLVLNDNTTGHVLIADNTGFKSKPISGDISILSSGQTSINSGVIVNDDISNDAKISISKTTLDIGRHLIWNEKNNEISVDITGGYGLSWDGSKLNATVNSGDIDDDDIVARAGIKMSKTNFSPTNKFIFDLNDGSFDIGDIYLLNNGDVMNGDLNITGQLTIGGVSTFNGNIMANENILLPQNKKIGIGTLPEYAIDILNNTNKAKIKLNGVEESGLIINSGNMGFELGTRSKNNDDIFYIWDNTSNKYRFGLNDSGKFILCDEANTNDEIKNATHKLTVIGDVKITDKITADDIVLNHIKLNSTFAKPSEMSHVKFNTDTAMFESGFKMDNIIDDSRDSEILIRENGVYKSKPVSGDVSISNSGEILIKSDIIDNDNINANANIHISKTNLSTVNTKTIGLIIRPDQHTLESSIIDDSIMDVHINSSANILMSKTNFSPNVGKMTYDDAKGTLDIKDVYINKTIEGNASRIDENINMHGDGNSDVNLKIYSDSTPNKASIRLGENETNSWEIFHETDKLEFKKYGTTNGTTNILMTINEGGDIDINGNLKLQGNEIIMPTIKTNNTQILIGDTTNIDGPLGTGGSISYTPKQLTGDIKINSAGMTTILPGKIGDLEIASGAEIDIGKTTLQAGTNVTIEGDGTINVPDMTLQSGFITDTYINNEAAIQISKTNLEIDTDQLELLGGNKLTIKDIYVKNKAGNLSDTPNILEGDVCIEPIAAEDTNLPTKDVKLKIYSKSDNFTPSLEIGKDSTDHWIIYNEKATKKFKI